VTGGKGFRCKLCCIKGKGKRGVLDGEEGREPTRLRRGETRSSGVAHGFDSRKDLAERKKTELKIETKRGKRHSNNDENFRTLKQEKSIRGG